MEYIKLDLGITKIYLLPIENGYVLLDTGYYSDYRKFEQKLAEKNIDISQIRYLLITHYHDDHAGFAQKLKEEYNIPLIVQQASVPLLAEGDSAALEVEHAITKRIKFIFDMFSVFHNSFKYPPVIVDKNDIILSGDDNNVLRKLGLQANVVFTPGHTCDSMCVLFDDGTGFVGDACMNFLRVFGAAYRPIYYTDEENMYKSIKKLISLGLKTVVPAHGNEYDVEKLKTMLGKFYKAK